MQLRCPQCGFTKDVDEATLPPGRLRVRCRQCQAPFEVAREEALEVDWGSRQARDPTLAGPAMSVAVREPQGVTSTGSLRDVLESEGAVTIVLRQRVRMGEVLTGFESAARYEVWGTDGTMLGRVGERSADITALLARWILKAQRPFEMLVDGLSGGVVLELKRGWYWFEAKLEVWDSAGTLIGTVEQRWRPLQRRFDLRGADGRVLGRIVSNFLHPWTFPVFAGPESNQRQVALIAKKWGGFFREAFTDADKFAISLPETNPVLRQLVFASALLIDFGYFEHGGDPRTGGVGKLLEMGSWFK